MHRLVFVFSVFLLAASPLLATDDPLAPMHAETAAARQALADGEPQIAESRMRSALLEGRDLLGRIAFVDGDLEAARDAFAEASISAVRGVHRPRTHLAVVDYRLGEETEALNQLRVLNDRFRSLPEPWEPLLTVLIRGERADEAREKLRELHGIDPDLAVALQEKLGHFAASATAPPAIDLGPLPEMRRRDRKKLRRAVEGEITSISADLAAMRAAPSPTEEFLRLVDAVRDDYVEAVRGLEQGRLDDAESWLLRLQEQGQDSSEVRQLLEFIRGVRSGSVRASLQMSQVAQRAASKQPVALLANAFESAPSSEEVLLAYGRACLDAQLPTRARGALEPLAGIYPDVSEYHLLYGRALAAVSASTDAVEAFQEAVRRDPESIPARLALGRAMNGEKRYEEARGHLERAREAEPEDLDILAALAESEEGLGELQAAEQRAQGVLELKRDHADAKFVLGMVRMKQERFQEARDLLADVVETNPRSAQGHYQLSLAYMRLGDRESAQRHLDAYKNAQKPQETLMKGISGPATMKPKTMEKPQTMEKN